MKKILVIVLSLMMTVGMFACESIFDKIDGITCEMQCFLCSEYDIDIKKCDKVLEKFEQYTMAKEKMRKANKSVIELKLKIEDLEKESNEINSAKLKELRYKYLDLLYDAGRAFAEYTNTFDNFLGEEGLTLLESEEFQNEFWNVLGTFADYNYLMD